VAQAQSGVDASVLTKVLPLLAMLVASHMANHPGAGTGFHA
jgi:hypothetical protein